MKTATVRQVRHDFGSVLQWVADGESVQVSKRGQVVAMIVPPVPPKRRRALKRPNFLARLQRIYGDKPRGANPILEERASRDY
jgi:antitoxin (DNA-binding transcriptional repressor) of toxin-antitoxin stability system